MTRPPVAVVLASFRPRPVAEPAIEALVQQCAVAGAALIVARRPTEPDEAWLRERFPTVNLVPCPAEAGVPEIRGAGLQSAAADWVLQTEDNCVADPDWLAGMRRACGAGVGVVGGMMGNARTTRMIDWGAFFAEYGFFGAGEPVLVTGANVAYRGDLVGRIATWSLAGDWEDVIHGRLSDSGVAVMRAEEAMVRQQLGYRLLPFLRDRFEHGRAYAAVRRATWGRTRRLLHGAAAPVLPLPLAVRIWRATGQDAPAAFWRALPATFAFLLAWSMGEFFGYLWSTPRHE